MSYIISRGFLITLFGLVTYYTITDACGGYRSKLNKLVPCPGSKNQMSVTNPKVTLQKDCRATFSGCGEISEYMNTLKLFYDVKKVGMPITMKGEKDLCEEFTKRTKGVDSASGVGGLFALDKAVMKCPISPVNACIEGIWANVSSLQDKLFIVAGQYSGNATIVTDTGSTCFLFNWELKLGK